MLFAANSMAFTLFYSHVFDSMCFPTVNVTCCCRCRCISFPI